MSLCKQRLVFEVGICDKFSFRFGLIEPTGASVDLVWNHFRSYHELWALTLVSAEPTRTRTVVVLDDTAQASAVVSPGFDRELRMKSPVPQPRMEASACHVGREKRMQSNPSER